MNNLLNNKFLHIVAVIVLAIGLRIALPFGTVFGIYTKFIGIDAYYHMGIITQYAESFPVALGQFKLWDWLIAGLAWLLAGGDPSVDFTEAVAAFMPPVFAGLTVFFVYIIGRKLVGHWGGLLSAIIIAFIPGEFWFRSLLGNADYHVAEVMFTTGAMMFAVLAAKSRGWSRWGYISGCIVMLGAYALTWRGYGLFIAILAAYMVVVYAVWLQKITKHALATAVVLAASVSIAGYLFIEYDPLNVMREIKAFTSTQSEVFLTTSEAQGSFSLIGFVSLVLPKCILAGVLCIPIWKYRELGNTRWLLIIWTFITIGATIWQRRFDYYLAVPLSLLGGLLLWRLYLFAHRDGLTQYAARNLILVCMAFLLLCFGVLIGTNSGKYYEPPDDWQESLIWVRDNTPTDSLVIAWWDYGYWINYIGERRALATPGQDVGDIRQTADILLQGGQLPPAKDIYLIIDADTASVKLGAMMVWGGEDIPPRDTLAYRLYESKEGFGRYHLEYEKLSVRVFKVEQ